MITVRKKEGKHVKAYRLGDAHPVLDRLIQEGKLVCHENGVFEIFSQESLSGKGQLALEGDYLKIDSAGYPYPNERDFFEKNHRRLEGLDQEYEQVRHPLQAWVSTLPLCPEIRFLADRKALVLNPGKPEAYFTAPLWGTVETADINAVLVFYSITRNESGEILDADFNFVQREEFDKTYDIICSASADMV